MVSDQHDLQMSIKGDNTIKSYVARDYILKLEHRIEALTTEVAALELQLQLRDYEYLNVSKMHWLLLLFLRLYSRYPECANLVMGKPPMC